MRVAVTKLIHTENDIQRLSVSFSTYPRSWTGIVGASGTGKTTLLRMIAGLAKPDYGKICINNQVVYDTEKRINIAPHLRNCGFVFQEPVLFPNLNVRQNIAYGCDDPELVEYLINLVHLSALSDRSVAKLSGGQKKRIALLRAVASKPACLLLDEPFSALDENKKNNFIECVIKLFEHFSFNVLLVSHNQEDVESLCDATVDVQHGGLIKQPKVPYVVGY